MHRMLALTRQRRALARARTGSPLVHGMTPISSVGRLEPPAKRLVLFVGTCLVMPCLHASTLIAGPIRYPRLSRLCSKLTSLLIAFNAMVYVVIMLLPTALLLVADGLR